VVIVPPFNAAWSCGPVGFEMPCCESANCASASECETLPQPIGFVGGVMMIVFVIVVPLGPVDVYVSVAGDPVRNAVARATAFSREPASVANGAANFPATRVWPGDAVVSGVVAGALPLGSAVSPTASVENASAINAAE